MIDRTRTLIAAAAVAVVVLLAVSLGYIAGSANSPGNDDPSMGENPVADGPGLPAGPSRVEGGVPMGFALSEDGALAAVATWVPMLGTSPPSEQPGGINDVLAPGVEPIPDELTTRISAIPWAGKVTMTSSTEATVELLTWVVRGDPATDVGFDLSETDVGVAWDDRANDWRITDLGTPSGYLDPPLSSLQADGYRALWPTGAALGAQIVEVPPGE